MLPAAAAPNAWYASSAAGFPANAPPGPAPGGALSCSHHAGVVNLLIAGVIRAPFGRIPIPQPLWWLGNHRNPTFAMKDTVLYFLLMALLLAAPAAFAQTAQPGQAVPSAEPPVKAVPQAGHQAKPQPVDETAGADNGPANRPDHAGRRHAADRAARRAGGMGHHDHGLGGHGQGGGHGRH